MSLRIATKADFDTVFALLDQIYRLHFARRPDIYREGPVICREVFEKCLADDEQVFLIWDEGDGPAGLCHMVFQPHLHDPLVKPCTVAYIEDFCVDAAVRRRGVGKRLFAAVKEFAKSRGADRLELNVWTVNPEARAFYEAEGLTEKSTRMECRL